MKRKSIKSALTLESLCQPSWRGGGLSCQSHTSAPKPHMLNKAALPETGRSSVMVSQEPSLTSSFSFWKARRSWNILRKVWNTSNRCTWLDRSEAPRTSLLALPTLRRSGISGVNREIGHPFYPHGRVCPRQGSRCRPAPRGPCAPPTVGGLGRRPVQV